MRHLKLYENFDEYSIIFLDIDGVLRPINSNIGKDSYGELFKKDCVEAFKYLIGNTNTKIVISSTWKSSGLESLKKMWHDRNLPGLIIDITPNEVDVVDSGNAAFYDLVDRGLEIEQWIKNNSYKGNYLIIDDITDFNKEQMDKFVKTNSYSGLTMDDVEKCFKILN